MQDYSQFIIGLWLVPVVLCILIPLAMLFMWSIKRILGDISASVKSVEGAVTEGRREVNEDVQPQPAN